MTFKVSISNFPLNPKELITDLEGAMTKISLIQVFADYGYCIILCVFSSDATVGLDEENN